MALDGAFLYKTAEEMRGVLVGSRVEKIAQPSKEELTVTFRLRGGSRKVLFSANASSPRVHFTDIALENPKTPPMFCMLLRKHIGSGKLVAIRQNGLDRVIAFDFETVNELGDVVIVTLAAEIMGRHSNLILIGPEGRIIDAVKRVSDEVSSVRTVLPGGTYVLPPAQDKLDLLCGTILVASIDRLRKIADADTRGYFAGVVQRTYLSGVKRRRYRKRPAFFVL